jgi:hypothetical protein
MRGPKRRGLLIFFVFTLGFSVLGFSFHFLHQSMDGGRWTKRSVGRVFSRILVSRFTCFELSRFLVFSVLLAISFCTLLYFRTTYNPLSYNVFCSDRFTDNGSRFTSFEPSMDGGRWTKWNVGRYFTLFQIAPNNHRQLDRMIAKNGVCPRSRRESVPEVTEVRSHSI